MVIPILGICVLRIGTIAITVVVEVIVEVGHVVIAGGENVIETEIGETEAEEEEWKGRETAGVVGDEGDPVESGKVDLEDLPGTIEAGAGAEAGAKVVAMRRVAPLVGEEAEKEKVVVAISATKCYHEGGVEAGVQAFHLRKQELAGQALQKKRERESTETGAGAGAEVAVVVGNGRVVIEKNQSGTAGVEVAAVVVAVVVAAAVVGATVLHEVGRRIEV